MLAVMRNEGRWRRSQIFVPVCARSLAKELPALRLLSYRAIKRCRQRRAATIPKLSNGKSWQPSQHIANSAYRGKFITVFGGLGTRMFSSVDEKKSVDNIVQNILGKSSGPLSSKLRQQKKDKDKDEIQINAGSLLKNARFRQKKKDNSGNVKKPTPNIGVLMELIPKNPNRRNDGRNFLKDKRSSSKKEGIQEDTQSDTQSHLISLFKSQSSPKATKNEKLATNEPTEKEERSRLSQLGNILVSMKEDSSREIKKKDDESDNDASDDFDLYNLPKMKKIQPKKKWTRTQTVLPKEVIVPDQMTLRDLSRWTKTSMKKINGVLVKQLGMRKLEPSEYLDGDTVEMIGVGIDINILVGSKISKVDRLPTVVPKEKSGLAPKPPVVCIMGHVNHGKTSLLDALRNTNVVEGEAGGITQSLGGFFIKSDGQNICFLDTPGHSIFHGMRSKGCRATDVAVILVSATDGVQEQTMESISIAQEHDVPMLVAISKCDVDGADVDKVKAQLMDAGIVVEDLGGNVICQEISSKTGEGLRDLVEAIQVLAETLDLRVDEKAQGEFIVIESKYSKGVGLQLNGIVRWGTLKVGDFFVCGKEYGRVRELVDSSGKKLKKAGPSTPVSISGLRGEDCFGDEGLVVKDEKTAKKIVEYRSNKSAYESIFNARLEVQEGRRKLQNSRTERKTKASTRRRPTSPVHDVIVEDIEDDTNTVHVIVRGDCQGSLEAILDYISLLDSKTVSVKVIKTGIGPPTQSDLDAAEIAGGNTSIIMFNVRASNKILKEADRLKISISTHDVIYSLMDEIRDRISELLPPVQKVNVLGTGEFIQAITLNAGRKSMIAAGLKVRSGKLMRRSRWRVLRDNEEVFACEEAESMRHFKEAVEYVGKGDECGVVIKGFEDYKVGDVLQCYEYVDQPAVFNDTIARRQSGNVQHHAITY